MIELDFLRQLDRFSLILQHKVNSNYSGSRESMITGQGLIFKDHKEYVFGDDFRNIDWRVFARSDKLFIRRFDEERNLTVHVIVDTSASMDYGSRILKGDYAAMLGIGFAYMAMKQNDRFVLSTFSEELEFFRARKGTKQLASMFNYLSNKKYKGKTLFEKAIMRYKKRIDSRSLIVIISDFLYDLDEIRNSIYRLKNNEIILLQVLDQRELKFNMEGQFKLEDLETKDTLKTFISSSLQKIYLKRLNSHNSNIKRICNEIGGYFFTTSTSTPIFDTFYDVLQKK